MREWTTTEVQVLRLFASMGVDAVAELLERSPSSVAHKAQQLGISTKVTGDDVDVAMVPAKVLLWVRQSASLNVCPSCGMRLAMMRATGLCRPCHLDRLIDLRREQLDVLARERKLTKLRQDKKRMRSCARCGSAFFPRPSSSEQLCPSCGGYGG